MCSKALLQEGLLPLLQWYLLDAGRDVVPERLHVVDLIFDRKRVKPRGRQWLGNEPCSDYTTGVSNLSTVAVKSGVAFFSSAQRHE